MAILAFQAIYLPFLIISAEKNKNIDKIFNSIVSHDS